MKCWELKNCIFIETNPKESKRPPYKQQCGCWEYDKELAIRTPQEVIDE